ncbi:MAG: SPFH domain-containing protein [Capsulimonadales bacterium]|nr:SPFH domain-containing protein [Capsulimonadales bacterium]
MSNEGGSKLGLIDPETATQRTRSGYDSPTFTETTARTAVPTLTGATQERLRGALPGAPAVILMVLLPIFAILSFFGGGVGAMGGIFLTILWFFLMNGFFTVEPNGSKVLMLFGKYQGTVKDNGFFLTNPFVVKRSISLRARTLNGDKIKVNDAVGNPIEIAAVIVWQVQDTYRACFEVEDYEQYVRLQAETAVRHMATQYPYDAEDEHLSLRRNTEEVSEALRRELDEKLARAGVHVLEARLSHLAYAPEIASAMLRRQQAAAVIAARQRIVEGAVGMVEMALHRLEEHETVAMTPDNKAALVSNLLVVLCSEQSAHPVVNASTQS